LLQYLSIASTTEFDGIATAYLWVRSGAFVGEI